MKHEIWVNTNPDNGQFNEAALLATIEADTFTEAVGQYVDNQVPAVDRKHWLFNMTADAWFYHHLLVCNNEHDAKEAWYKATY